MELEVAARDLVARAETEESGAFLAALARAVPTIISAASSFFGGHKREILELEVAARQLSARATDEESGAFLAALARAVPTIVSVASNLFGGHKRDVK